MSVDDGEAETCEGNTQHFSLDIRISIITFSDLYYLYYMYYSKYTCKYNYYYTYNYSTTFQEKQYSNAFTDNCSY